MTWRCEYCRRENDTDTGSIYTCKHCAKGRNWLAAFTLTLVCLFGCAKSNGKEFDNRKNCSDYATATYICKQMCGTFYGKLDNANFVLFNNESDCLYNLNPIFEGLPK